MEIDKAKNILGLNEGFTQKELIGAYKKNIAENDPDITAGELFETYSDAADHLYDISEAYLLLRDSSEIIEQETIVQPLIIFTDASARKDMGIASFGIVAKNIISNFNIPFSLIDKYQIQPERNTNNKDICILSGIVSNYDINASEMMAILGSLEIFLHSVITTQQKIVIYTDSLIAKKVFSDKRRPPNTKLYEKLRDRFNQIIGSYRLDVIIKKVNAHVGIELNEIADATAKDRLRRIL